MPWGDPFYRRRALNWIDREPDRDAIAQALDEIMGMVAAELEAGHVDLVPDLDDDDQDVITRKAQLIRLAMLHRRAVKLRELAAQRRKEQHGK